MFHSLTQRRAIQVSARVARRSVFSVCWLLVACFTLPSQSAEVVAQSSGQGETAQEVIGPVNERQALQIARARFEGNVISINEVRQNGRVRFRIRMDNEGNIFTVYIDKATGVVIEG
ncbi:hypothetical protein GCM10011403_25900 [Pseudohongiella nitratireducens]|uniref:PepSY domain-containing protein n=1 Tax=Pseudohongiella nitratireducens TaxID=1768907 RepID=A0A916QL01_9GAMM|nr:PepSY domain-containing protein [Pseudohongiella nitratireducens]GFZ81442.1 hypothetical protein GCM10011403_25900 [Pseudohongiella nitratireducens]